MADEMKRVGIVFKADGSVNFQKTLKEVNQTVNENRSAFALAKSEWDASTSSMQKLRDQQEYLANQTEAYSEKVRQLNDILKQLEEAESRDEVEISKTKQQLNNAQAALNNYEKGLADVTAQLESGAAKLEDYAKKVSEVGDKMTSVGNSMTKGITAPILGIGAAAGAAWVKVDEAYDNIAAGTGATGEALQELQDSFDNVYGNFKADSEDTSKAIADINTRFGFTGEILENCSKDFLKFAEVNNTDVSSAIQNVSRYMGDAGIESSQYADVLDALTAASQASGISVDNLAETLTKYGAPMRALGLSTQESIALFAQWEKAGVNTETAFSGMKKAISNWASEGKDAKVEFQKTLDTIASAPDIASATTLAIDAFGTKAGPDLADAIQGGRFSVEEFLKVVENSEGQLNDSFEAMQDGPDEAKEAMHQLQLAGADLSEAAISSFAPVLTDIIADIKDLVSWFTGLDDGTKEMIVRIALLVAALGPMLSIGGKLVSGIGTMISLYAKAKPIIAGVKTGLSAINAVMGAGTLTTLGIIGAIGALIAIVVVLYQNCEEFRNGVNLIWENISEIFTEKIPEAGSMVVDFFKNNWAGILLFIINPFLGGFKLLYDNCDSFKEKVDGIVDSVKEKWETIADAVGEVVDSIKGAWQAVKEAIKLPHFSVSGSFDLMKGKVPKLSIDWYANGGILNKPTIFGANGNRWLGGGEAGPEAVTPISTLLDYIRIANAESNADIINALEQILPAAVIAGLNECPIKLNLTIGNKAFTEEAAMKVIKLLSLGTSNKAAMKGA